MQFSAYLRQHANLARADWGAFKPASGSSKVAKKAGARPKSASGGKSKAKKGTGGTGSSGGGPGDDGMLSNLSWLLVAYMLFSTFSGFGEISAGVDRIDFQTFRNDVLKRDVVDKVRAAGPSL